MYIYICIWIYIYMHMYEYTYVQEKRSFFLRLVTSEKCPFSTSLKIGPLSLHAGLPFEKRLFQLVKATYIYDVCVPQSYWSDEHVRFFNEGFSSSDIPPTSWHQKMPKRAPPPGGGLCNQSIYISFVWFLPHVLSLFWLLTHECCIVV